MVEVEFITEPQTRSEETTAARFTWSKLLRRQLQQQYAMRNEMGLRRRSKTSKTASREIWS